MPINPEPRYRISEVGELLQFICGNAANFFQTVFRIKQPIFLLVINGLFLENRYVHDIQNARFGAVNVQPFPPHSRVLSTAYQPNPPAQLWAVR